MCLLKSSFSEASDVSKFDNVLLLSQSKRESSAPQCRCVHMGNVPELKGWHP